MDTKLHAPYAMNYTLGFQRALTSTLVLESAFVGNRGLKFTGQRLYNEPDRVTGLRPNPNLDQNRYWANSDSTFYASGRDPWDCPGRWNLDFSLAKNFQLRESMRLQFRADILNALNHTDLVGVVTNIGQSNFGQLVGATKAIQFHCQPRVRGILSGGLW